MAITLEEDSLRRVITLAELISGGGDITAGINANEVTGILIVVRPVGATLTYGGNAIAAGTIYTYTSATTSLAITLDANHDQNVTFTFTLLNDRDVALGVGNGSARFTINVTPVNDTPVLAVRDDLFINEGVLTLTREHLHITDIDSTDTPANLTYTVKSLPAGTLHLADTALGVDDTFTQADIDAGRVRYTPDADRTSTEFTFTFSDGETESAAQTAYISLRHEPIAAPGADNNITLTSASIVESGGGKDTIRGSTGNDRIDAGLDDDIIELDTDDSAATADGADEVVYEVAEDDAGFTARSGSDIIRGFKPGDDQLIFKFTTPAPSGKTPLEVFLEGVNDKFHVRPLVDDGVVGLLFLFPESILLAGGRLSGSLLFLYFDEAYTVDAFKELIRTEGATDISDMANLDIDPLTFNITTSRALKAIFAGSRDGTGGLGAETGTAAMPPEDFTAMVTDGPIHNAKVYVDINGNGRIDIDTDISIGTTNANGRITIDARYAGWQLLADLTGAIDTQTGARFSSSSHPYKATAPEQTSSTNGVVLSPLTTAIADLMADGMSEGFAIEMLFGAGSGITMADIYNADNYLRPTNPTPKQQTISQKAIEIQVLYEETANPTEAKMRLADGFDPMEDLSESSRTLVGAREAAIGQPAAADMEATVTVANANGRLTATVTDADQTSGTLDVSYQWYKVVGTVDDITAENGDDILIDRATSASYLPGAASLTLHGLTFRAVASGTAGNRLFARIGTATQGSVSVAFNWGGSLNAPIAMWLTSHKTSNSGRIKGILGLFDTEYARVLADETTPPPRVTPEMEAGGRDLNGNPITGDTSFYNIIGDPFSRIDGITHLLTGGGDAGGTYYVRVSTEDSAGGTTITQSAAITVSAHPTGTLAIEQVANGRLQVNTDAITDSDNPNPSGNSDSTNSNTISYAYEWYQLVGEPDTLPGVPPGTTGRESDDIKFGATGEHLEWATVARATTTVAGIVFEVVAPGTAGNNYRLAHEITADSGSHIYLRTSDDDITTITIRKLDTQELALQDVIDLINGPTRTIRFTPNEAYGIIRASLAEGADGTAAWPSLAVLNAEDNVFSTTKAGLERLVADGERYYAVVTAMESEGNGGSSLFVSDALAFTDTEAAITINITRPESALVADVSATDADHIDTDPDTMAGDIAIAYQWYQATGTIDAIGAANGDDMRLADATQSSFTPDAVGNYYVRITTTDSAGGETTMNSEVFMLDML